MVGAQKNPFGVGDREMHPLQGGGGPLFGGFFGHVCLYILFYVDISTGLVTEYDAFLIDVLPYRAVDLIGVFCRQYLHLEISAVAARFSSFYILQWCRFCHYRHISLPLRAFSPVLGLVRIFSFHLKMPLVKLYNIVQSVHIVALSHRSAQFVHHLPDRLVAPVPHLALYLQGGEAFFGSTYKKLGDVPFPERHIARLHYRTATQGGPCLASLTLVLFFVLQPIMARVRTVFADNTCLIPNLLKMGPATLLVRKFLAEF